MNIILLAMEDCPYGTKPNNSICLDIINYEENENYITYQTYKNNITEFDNNIYYKYSSDINN